MKAKIKLDVNTIKNFFLDHVEKVVVGIVALSVVMIVYSAVNGRDKTDQRPEDLVTKVGAAKAAIEQSRVVEKTAGEVEKIAEMSSDPVSEEPYLLSKPLCPPINKLEHPRGSPPVLPVEQLRVAAGMGMFQHVAPVKNPAGDKKGGDINALGGQELRGQRWVGITALVPVKKQAEAFVDTFCDCRHLDPQKDSYPIYGGYWVDRLEVTSPADLKNPNWNDTKKVTKFRSDKAKEAAMKDWGTPQMDPIDTKYIDPVLTFPLGPWTDGVWDASVAHEPEIPFGINSIAAQPTPAAEETKETDKEKPSPADKEANFEDHRMQTAQGGMPVGGHGAMPYAPQMPQMLGGHGGAPGGGYMPGRLPIGMSAEAAGVEYRLFRFFDFTVEPGKRYIYRVRLGVENPNHEVKEVFLEKPELAKDKILMDAKWSDPTPVIAIPNDASTLAVAVEQPKSVKADTLASMIVALWQHDTGRKVYSELAVERGQFLNFKDADVKGPPTNDPRSSASDKADLLTNVLVVDLAGGKKLPGKMKPPTEEVTDQYSKKLPAKDRAAFSPGEILIMEKDGTLVVRNEFDDMTAVDNYVSGPANPAAMPAGGYGPMMPGMPGGHGAMPGYGMPSGRGAMPGYGGMPSGRGAMPGYGMPGGGHGAMPGMPGGHGVMPGGYAPPGAMPGYGDLFGGPKQGTNPKKKAK